MAFSFGATAQPQAQQQTGFGSRGTASASASTPSFGFGATAQPAAGAANTGTGLFGSTGGATGGGGLFGAGAQAKPAGSLFGNAGTTGATGGLFGSTQQQQQQQPAAGGGLFGSTGAQPAAAGGLFGSTGTQPAATGGLFGSTQPQQQQVAGGGLFGSTPAQPAASGGLFGSATAAQPAATGGLFGAAAKPAGGLFGSTTQQPAQMGGLFGSATQQPAQGGGLFGSTAQQPAQAPGLFGSTSQPQAGGLFSSTTQPQAGGLFGSTTQPQQGSMLGASAPGQGLGASAAQPPKEQDITSRIMAIKNAWDVNSPECRFKYYFYNVVEPGMAPHYGRPAGAVDDAKWARAVRDNPDPANMVPVLATGWADVQKRVQAQEQTASVHQQRVKELNEALANLSRQTALSSSVRLAALQNHLAQLTQRLLHLAAASPSFAPVQSSAFRPEEGEMKETLDEVKDTLDGRVRVQKLGGGGGGGTVGLAAAPRAPSRGRLLGQVNELWGAIEEVRARRRAQGYVPDGRDGWDERLLAEIATVLEQQQTALTKLAEVASRNVFDADVMRQLERK